VNPLKFIIEFESVPGTWKQSGDEFTDGIYATEEDALIALGKHKMQLPCNQLQYRIVTQPPELRYTQQDMAKLKATPKNFAEAVEVLKDKISVRLGNNTYLEVTDADPVHGFIGVRLHDTYIVKFWSDGQIRVFEFYLGQSFMPTYVQLAVFSAQTSCDTFD